MPETSARPHALFHFIQPFQAFFRMEAASGIVLLFCTVVAVVWANSPYSDSYFSLWRTEVTIGAEGFELRHSLQHWINDALMAIFFLMVGLEIKREVLIGELSSIKSAALPLIGALGGMVVPAVIYSSIAFGFGTEQTRRGWAVPMATDIAFALGVLALMSKRVPTGLKVFLAALAIADDLGAVLVIAFFYTAQLSFSALASAAVILLALIAMNRMGVRRSLVYVLLGVALWVAVLKSGIHATIAGVALAMTIPARRAIDEVAFLARGRALLDEFARGVAPGETDPSPDQRHAVQALEGACELVTQPLHRFEHALHPWVAYGIMPIFALANAGGSLGKGVGEAVQSPVWIAVFCGLFIGKPLGIFGFSWLAVRTGIANLPTGASWRQLFGVATLCGIGFTMSIFIASLAFTSPAYQDHAKLGILAASTLAAIAGAIILLTGKKPQPDEPATAS